MNEFILGYSFELNNFTIKLYYLNNQNYINENDFNIKIDQLKNITNPKDLMENLSLLDGIVKIEIFSSENKLLLSSSLIVE